MKKLSTATLATLLIWCGTTDLVQGGIVENEVADVAGPICVFDGFSSTQSPNNGDYVGSAAGNLNKINYFLCIEQVDAVDFVFNVRNSGGKTEYVFETVNGNPGVVNFTGSNWVAYKFELGYGVGDNFVKSGLQDQLSFDTPVRTAVPEPTSNTFTRLTHGWNTITWFGGVIPPNNQSSPAYFQLSIDVPDNISRFHPDGLSQFTLRQTPLTRVRSP